MPTINAWFDGCCEPTNPGGHAAYGVVIEVDGETKLMDGGYVGCGSKISNNVAEYAGVIRILEALKDIPGTATVYGDSNLVINQLNGKWGARGGLYMPYLQRAKALLAPIKDRVRFEWIPRVKNEMCDSLSKDVLRQRGIEFRIQAEHA
jgi:ribonuclease HI